jgi:chemotaxis protein methyltransferase WspC
MIERLIEGKIGLAADMLGIETLHAIIRRRMEECGLSQMTDYLSLLNTTAVEWENLIEAVIVPETWFFRNEESFVFLGQYLKMEWLSCNKNSPLRILSAPCSTGEEPYSIAITLLEAGIPATRFTIDAVDISRKGLRKAQQGLYGQESFRRQDTMTLRDQYFTTTPAGHQLSPTLMQSVQFRWANILEDATFTDVGPYDIIFCRNLLIYLTTTAKDKVIKTFNRLLTDAGILFVGHAERGIFQSPELVAITIPGVFAYHRAGKLNEEQLCQQHRQPSRFERRSSPRPPLPPPTLPKSNAVGMLPKGETKSIELPVIVEHRRPPDETIQMLDTARILADRGNLHNALALCEKVLEQNATHVQAYFLKGLIHQALKDASKAEESFNKTIYLDPNHYEALYYLALIMEDRGDADAAGRLRQRIQRIQQRAGNKTSL